MVSKGARISTIGKLLDRCQVGFQLGKSGIEKNYISWELKAVPNLEKEDLLY